MLKIAKLSRLADDVAGSGGERCRVGTVERVE